jgi:ankyrin repeat protein
MSREGLNFSMVEAIVADDAKRVVALLEAGADVNAVNERGETAFSYACANNALAVARALLVRGAEINTVDAGGGSPLDWAVCWSSPEFRAWLIEAGGRRHDTSYEPWAWPPGSEGGCRSA